MNTYNTTVIDKKAYTDFQIFHGRFFKRVFFVNVIYYAVCALIIAYAFYRGISLNNTPLILLGATLVIIWLGLLYSKYVQPRLNFKKNVGGPVTVKYHFYPNTFIILKNGASEEGADRLPYKNIVKVYEAKEMLYLYYTKRIAYMVSKSGFETADGFSAFTETLKNILGKKYIKCR